MDKSTCSVADCARPTSCKGWCSAHYQRWRKHGDPLAGPPFRKPRGAPAPPCSVVGCDRGAKSRGRCDMHYRRWLSSGDDGEPTKRTPGAGCHAYPPDAQLLALMSRLGTFNAVARQLGVARESLRDYLGARPALRDQMVARRTPRLTPDEVRENSRRAARDWARQWRASNPEESRRYRRQHMATYGPGYRHKWNHYNRLRRLAVAVPDALAVDYALILRGDPCAYCGGPMEHIDHITPIARGGVGTWDNLTAACSSCNQSKHTRTLLDFLLCRLAMAPIQCAPTPLEAHS